MRTQEEVKKDIVAAWQRLYELAEESKAILNPTEKEINEAIEMVADGRRECGVGPELGFAADLLDVLDEIELQREENLDDELERAKRGEKNLFNKADEFKPNLLQSAYQYLIANGVPKRIVEKLHSDALFSRAARKGWKP